MARPVAGAVAEALQEAGVRPRQRLIVAVSGGVDSMVLLHALLGLMPRLQCVPHVVHIHHGLRGRSADKDAALVAETAARYGVPVTVERLAAAERPRGESTQVWAREARYARLEAVRKRVRAAWIVTAHNKNDQAETVLLNLLRGTGPRGLAGIPAVRHRILRPLLGVARADIMRYAEKHQVRYREDPSNRSLAYRRNRIRHTLLPMLARDYNPKIVEALAAVAAGVREDDAALETYAAAVFRQSLRKRGRSVGVSAACAQAAPPALRRRLFQEAFRRVDGGRHGLTGRHVAALTRLVPSGRGRIGLPGGLEAWASANTVWMGPPVRASLPRIAAEVQVRPGEWTRWASGHCGVRVRRVAAYSKRLLGADPCRQFLSPTVLDGPVSLRPWRPGDRFRPLGLGGTKKLQDFFTDAKVPRADRVRVPLLISDGRIAWVVGHRVSEEFRWRGEGAACLAEVRFSEGRHGLSTGRNAAVGR